MFRLGLFARCSAAAAGGLTSSFYGSNFRISERAWRRIESTNSAEGVPNNSRYLRLAIDSGGCHGFVYKFAFESMDMYNPQEDVLLKESDAVVQQCAVGKEENEESDDAAAAAAAVTQQCDGTDSSSSSSGTTGDGVVPPQVVVDKFSIGKLEGAVIDYHSELKGSAFVVVGNELVDQSCACAMSFSIRKGGKKGAATGASTAAGAGAAAGKAGGSTSGKGQPITRRGSATQ